MHTPKCMYLYMPRYYCYQLDDKFQQHKKIRNASFVLLCSILHKFCTRIMHHPHWKLAQRCTKFTNEPQTMTHIYIYIYSYHQTRLTILHIKCGKWTIFRHRRIVSPKQLIDKNTSRETFSLFHNWINARRNQIRSLQYNSIQNNWQIIN